jgi:hypothetical protein
MLVLERWKTMPFKLCHAFKPSEGPQKSLIDPSSEIGLGYKSIFKSIPWLRITGLNYSHSGSHKLIHHLLDFLPYNEKNKVRMEKEDLLEVLCESLRFVVFFFSFPLCHSASVICQSFLGTFRSLWFYSYATLCSGEFSLVALPD